MKNHPKKTKDYRFLFILTFCAVAGALLNSHAALADNARCNQSDNPTTECMTQSPAMVAVEGALMGVVAGAGAAIGAVWRHYF